MPPTSPNADPASKQLLMSLLDQKSNNEDFLKAISNWHVSCFFFTYLELLKQ